MKALRYTVVPKRPATISVSKRSKLILVSRITSSTPRSHFSSQTPHDYFTSRTPRSQFSSQTPHPHFICLEHPALILVPKRPKHTLLSRMCRDPKVLQLFYLMIVPHLY